jgi:hypothetical protein
MSTHQAGVSCFRRVMRDRFYQFSWRPRPPSLLSEADLKEIARNLRKYSEKYAKEDDVLMAQVRLLLQGGSPMSEQHAQRPQVLHVRQRGVRAADRQLTSADRLVRQQDAVSLAGARLLEWLFASWLMGCRQVVAQQTTCELQISSSTRWNYTCQTSCQLPC